ncbi:MAG TPA: glycosyltransferase [Microbacteriaceae bacterium]|nr:glycosyltransferase [Microbacteriaceae bacterium]
MRVALRADAGVEQGSGHVMRCLTLAEALLARGHEVELHAALEGVDWLEQAVSVSGARFVVAERDRIDPLALRGQEAVVIDSYRIPAAEISALPMGVLAIVDGESRGIRAGLYLDQNLGAEGATWHPPGPGRVLAGARYALVRDAILSSRRAEPWRIDGRPRVLLVLGGTDPHGLTVRAAAALDGLAAAAVTVVVGARWREQVAAAAPSAAVVETTPRLPELLAAADVVVSAAGTSAWDVCALGVPAVLVAVVENQQRSLAAASDAGVCLGIDVAAHGAEALSELPGLVGGLVDDEATRRTMSLAARAAVDGLGKVRVVEELERLVRGRRPG